MSVYPHDNVCSLAGTMDQSPGRRTVGGLAYDQESYLESLGQIGSLVRPEGVDLYLLAHWIPGTDLTDVTASIPYSAALASVEPRRLRTWLDRSGFVTFVGSIPPGRVVDRAVWQSAGFEVNPLKTCYLHESVAPPLEFSARTRRNLRLADRHWTVRPVALAQFQDDSFRWYGAMLERRNVHPMLHYPSEHFAALARMPGIGTLGAWDENGLGALLIYAETASEVHFHIAVGDARAYRTAGFYALFQAAIARFGERKRILLTGAPHVNRGGLARFKARFSNSTGEILLVSAVLRPALEVRLREQFGTHAWFPAYHNPTAKDLYTHE